MVQAKEQGLAEAEQTLREAGVFFEPGGLELPYYFWEVDDLDLVVKTLNTLLHCWDHYCENTQIGGEQLFQGLSMIAEALISFAEEEPQKALMVSILFTREMSHIEFKRLIKYLESES